MARIFVSYNRKNIEFCKRLTDELLKRDLDLWVDWEDIPPTVDWLKEIEKGVEEADTFLAIITNEWIGSRNCTIELEYAVKNGKRLIPVVPYDIVWGDVPPDLALLNFIFFTEKFDYNTQLEKLFTALNTDYDWLKTHRRLQVKALDWERSNKENGFLLHGKDLETAEQGISINANKDPHPTDIQREYILISRQVATRQNRIARGILSALVAVMLGVIGLLVRPYVEEAIAKAQAQDLSKLITVPAGNVDIDWGNGVQSFNLPKFSIEMAPVTNRVFGLCVNVNKCTPPIGSTDFNDDQKQDDPVVWATIVQASTYCNWVGRRLPSTPEWERAALVFAQPNTNEDHFATTELLEWTSSYLEGDSLNISGEWDEQLKSIDINWSFLQLGVNFSPVGDMEIYPNTTAALVTNPDIGFRCVAK